MRQFGDIVERLRRSTVRVLDPRGETAGSGIIWDSRGLIVTNDHVAKSDAAEVELWEGTRMAATRVKHDVRRDLALLEVAGRGLPAVPVGDSTRLRTGELAIAVGNPLGFAGAVSTGVVHSVGRVRGLGRAAWVQSSVRLAPGNSGGPLASASGEVIGVNTMIAGAGRKGTLALSVPSATTAGFVSPAAPEEAELGVTVRPLRLREPGRTGFLILETRPGLAADRASLMIGDLLTGANGRPFTGVDDLDEAIERARGFLALHFRRGGAAAERTVVVAFPEGSAAAA